MMYIFKLQRNNLFFVGDTKQSIYAFRQSDPEIFLNIEKMFNTSENSEAMFLNCNFRTNKNILYFVNLLKNPQKKYTITKVNKKVLY